MIKPATLLSVFFLLLATVANAEPVPESMYITETIEVMIRTGPDVTHKIISMPKSGSSVEVLEVLDDWVRVRLPNNKEGWMLSRYVTSSPPSRDIIKKLEQENGALKLRVKTLSEENTRVRQDLKEVKKALSTSTNTSETLRKSYEDLKSGSKDFLGLKASYDKAAKELAASKKKLTKLERELEELRDSQTMRWFIAGASVVVVGFFIGYMSRRPRRRSSLL